MRIKDNAAFSCPICGKKPYIKIYGVNTAYAYCKGHGLHRHKEVSAFVWYEESSKLIETLLNKWNNLYFCESRFLFNENGDNKETVK